MNPKEKAEELYYRFTSYAPVHSDNKQCALIAVDEILEELIIINLEKWYYWQEVKTELENL